MSFEALILVLLWLVWVYLCYKISVRVVMENAILGSKHETLWGIVLLLLLICSFVGGLIVFVVWVIVEQPDLYRAFPELERFKKKKQLEKVV